MEKIPKFWKTNLRYGWIFCFGFFLIRPGIQTETTKITKQNHHHLKYFFFMAASHCLNYVRKPNLGVSYHHLKGDMERHWGKTSRMLQVGTWKINGWNLKTTLFEKENSFYEPNLHDFGFHINFERCIMN